LSKVILVLSDGLRYDTAVASMGYLGHLVEKKLASLYKVIGELPSMSRPMKKVISQFQIAPTIGKLPGINIPPSMKQPTVI